MLKCPWFDTPSAHEHADSAGTHLFQHPSVVSDRIFNSPENLRIRQRVLYDLAGVQCAVTRQADELFVLYGTIFPNQRADGAAIGKFHAQTLEPLWKRKLIESRKEKEWNYPGAVGVHRDGFVYVVYGYRFSKLDPITGEILSTLTLPTNQSAQDSAYNGYIVMNDNVVIAKSVSRKAGCVWDGYKAYRKCGKGDSPSILVAIDTETMEIISQAECPEFVGSRICGGIFQGNEYIYMAGFRCLHRFLYKNKTLSYDSSWGPLDYLQGTQMNGSAPALMNDFVLLSTNGVPSTEPMETIAVSQADSSIIHRYTPFPKTRNSLNPCKVAVDPFHSTLFVVDGLAGKMASLMLDPDNGFSLQWIVNQSSFSFMNLIGDPKHRILVSNEMRIPYLYNKLKTWNHRFDFLIKRAKYEIVVWREARTGKELLRSPRFERGAFTMTHGFSNRLYVPAASGDKLYEFQILRD